MARGWRCLPDSIGRAQLHSIKKCRPRAGRRSPKSMRTNWLFPASWRVNGLGWWLLRLRGLHGLRFCDEPQHHIYDIEESSLVLSHVVEPEDLTFAEDVEINDDTIFVQDDPFYDEITAAHLYRRMVKFFLQQARRPDGDNSAKFWNCQQFESPVKRVLSPFLSGIFHPIVSPWWTDWLFSVVYGIFGQVPVHVILFRWHNIERIWLDIAVGPWRQRRIEEALNRSSSRVGVFFSPFVFFSSFVYQLASLYSCW